MERERKHNNSENVSNLADNCVSIEGNATSESSINCLQSQDANILIIEPFYGGSHKQLIDFLTKHVKSILITLSAKKWPWRARCSALILSEMIPQLNGIDTLFCSSVLSLAELVGMRRDLQPLRKIVYFHENQLVYPIREIKQRDIQFGYNQITTCLAADIILFNSTFNMESFLNNINKIVKIFPDYKPKQLREKILKKSSVLYYPVIWPEISVNVVGRDNECLVIVWPHRWEFDKDPQLFINLLLKLKAKGCRFKFHILGETFVDVPDIFAQAQNELKKELLSFGYLPSKSDYYRVLGSSHVVLSTAKHEFFGVSMLEATYCGCFPLAPNDLVYPEIYPKECLFDNEEECFDKLANLCQHPQMAIDLREKLNIDFNRFGADRLLTKYLDLLSK